MTKVRAWRVRPGDVLLSPVFDRDAWQGGCARPLIDDQPFHVLRARLRFIAPAFEVAGEDGSTGEMSGYGPMDWVTIQEMQAA